MREKQRAIRATRLTSVHRLLLRRETQRLQSLERTVAARETEMDAHINALNAGDIAAFAMPERLARLRILPGELDDLKRQHSEQQTALRAQTARLQGAIRLSDRAAANLRIAEDAADLREILERAAMRRP